MLHLDSILEDLSATTTHPCCKGPVRVLKICHSLFLSVELLLLQNRGNLTAQACENVKKGGVRMVPSGWEDGIAEASYMLDYPRGRECG